MENIPIVNFAAYGLSIKWEDCPLEQKEELAKKIYQAFTNIGFVYLLNCGIEKQQVDEVFNLSKKFFELDPKLKTKYVRNHAANHGWVADTERLNPQRPADYKESFDVTPYNTDVSALWPDDDVAGFKDGSLDFFSQLHQLALRILDIMALALDLKDPDYFRKCHNISAGNNGTSMRYLYYPEIANTSELKPKQLRCGEHTDYGCMTLLFQDDVGGLEVKNRQGEYIKATPIPGALLVNIADLMQHWTADIFVSTYHRVLMPKGETVQGRSRQSIVFFVHPDRSQLIECLDGSNKYTPIISADHLQKRLNETHTVKY